MKRDGLEKFHFRNQRLRGYRCGVGCEREIFLQGLWGARAVARFPQKIQNKDRDAIQKEHCNNGGVTTFL